MWRGLGAVGAWRTVSGCPRGPFGIRLETKGGLALRGGVVKRTSLTVNDGANPAMFCLRQGYPRANLREGGLSVEAQVRLKGGPPPYHRSIIPEEGAVRGSWYFCNNSEHCT
jgi:hypothetical protein